MSSTTSRADPSTTAATVKSTGGAPPRFRLCDRARISGGGARRERVPILAKTHFPIVQTEAEDMYPPDLASLARAMKDAGAPCKVMRKSMLRFRLNRNYSKLEIADLEPRANIWRVGVGSSSVEPPRYGSRNNGQTEVNAESSAQDRPTGSH